jgi:hypothetical protein
MNTTLREADVQLVRKQKTIETESNTGYFVDYEVGRKLTREWDWLVC